MSELKVGDHVLGKDGNPTQVIAATEVMYGRPCYEMTFDKGNGESIICDADHLWKTEMRSARPGGGAAGGGKTLTGVPRSKRGAWKVGVRKTREIAETLYAQTHEDGWALSNHSIPVAAIGGEYHNPPIPPYTLGAWLGDGDADAGRITCADEDVALFQRIEMDGIRVLERRGSKMRAGRYTVSMLTRALRENNLLYNKRIPALYLRASFAQRLELLRGIMDTDGHVTKTGACEISLANRHLIGDVAELLRSLGIKANILEKRFKYRGEPHTAYRIGFAPPAEVNVFWLPRKAKRLDAVKSKRRGLARSHRITGCEPVKSVPVRCIQVAAEDGMFLYGHAMIPTHNSPLVAGQADSTAATSVESNIGGGGQCARKFAPV